MNADLVLADIPERNRLRELVTLLNLRRDEIAELDLELESLRQTLATFEAKYATRLRPVHAALHRVESLIRHIERWADVVRQAREAPDTARDRVLSRAERHEEKRRLELEEMLEASKAEP